MIDRREDVDYLRWKAAQCRKLAAKQATPLSAKMSEIAEALEEHAAAIEAHPVKKALSSYRVYFRTTRGTIAGREDFKAEGDWSAQVIATELLDACSDVCASFELWDGTRRLDNEAGGLRLTSADLSRRTQETVIEREIVMRDGHWQVAQSKRLLERIRRFTEERGAAC